MDWPGGNVAYENGQTAAAEMTHLGISDGGSERARGCMNPYPYGSRRYALWNAGFKSKRRGTESTGPK